MTIGIERDRLPRLNVRRLVVDTGSNGVQFPPPSEDPFLIPAQVDADTDARKRERTVLSAIIIDLVIKKAFAQRHLHPPHGLTQPLTLRGRGEPEYDGPFAHTDQRFGDLRWRMSGTLNDSFGQEIQSLERGLRNSPTDPISTVYSRFRSIVTSCHGTPETWFEGGVSVAVDVMAKVLEVIPRVYQRQFPGQVPDVPTLVDIAHNSLPVISGLALEHVIIFNRKTDFLEESPALGWDGVIDPRHFLITQTKNGPRLIINEASRAELEMRLAHTPLEGYGANTSKIGCPALFSPNPKEDSAIEVLWNWHVDIARDIYRDVYPETST